MTYQPPIAFFGATGGCTSNCLALTLKAGYKATALARTPNKLTEALLAHSVPKEVLDSNLTIVSGAIQDISAVKRTLCSSGNNPASLIIFGVGGSPKLQASIMYPATIDNPHICEEGMSSIRSALEELKSESIIGGNSSNPLPILTVLSTTGVSKKKRDVPLPIVPLYHWMGRVPHADKRVMENAVVRMTDEGLLQDHIIMRPSLLTDGAMLGLEKVKIGWEYHEKNSKAAQKGEKEQGPAVGYTISRADVGNFMFENIVKGTGAWNAKCVSLTY